ncbi:MAG: hypothetical protein K1X29_08085 [Bdellovibrionales bacterium]|nr:hypothetical protein [Bdellovibrionales bacterium]
MKWDIFFSICQTEVDGFMPTEKQMWQSFFDQVQWADELRFGVAWIAETHLSCETQKSLPNAVIPHFKGEIGLNTDILQLAPRLFAMTQHIEIGSAIRNIICNGGPIAHAEALRTFLNFHQLEAERSGTEKPRKLHLGFAAGRFDFSNRPYGINPRSPLEEKAWPVIKGKIFSQATEVFLRLLRGDSFASKDIKPIELSRNDFRSSENWEDIKRLSLSSALSLEKDVEKIVISPFWNFEKIGVIPKDVSLENLSLTIGTHDPQTQILANQYLPVGVFNLSITPKDVIESTHLRMKQNYHPSGGAWRRELMPRTVMVFIDCTKGISPEERKNRAQIRAKKAWENYWLAMEGTLDDRKVQQAVNNALVGTAEDIVQQIHERYETKDRLMLWFDFNCHDNEWIKKSMKWFMEEVAPRI